MSVCPRIAELEREVAMWRDRYNELADSMRSERHEMLQELIHTKAKLE